MKVTNMVGIQWRPLIAAVLLLLSPACGTAESGSQDAVADETARMLAEGGDGENWAGYGGTYGEQHFSPLTEINDGTISRMGLVWSMDLPPGNAATIPLEIDGVLYFASGLSVVHAVDAATGKLLWRYDPEVAKVAGARMRPAWGSRGIGYWNGRIYTGTLDGRLIAIDAQTGKPDWSVSTVEEGDLRCALLENGMPRFAEFDDQTLAALRQYIRTKASDLRQQQTEMHSNDPKE